MGLLDKLKEMSTTMMVVTIAVALLVAFGVVWFVRSKSEGMVDESDTMKYARLAELFVGGKDNINNNMAARLNESFTHGLA